MWYSAVACFIVVIFGGSISAIMSTRGRKTKAEPMKQDLYAPVIETLLACWPQKLRAVLRDNRLVSSRRLANPEEAIGVDLTEDILRSFIDKGQSTSSEKTLYESGVSAIAKRRRDVETAVVEGEELTEL